MRIATRLIVGFSFLLALPAAAQQAAPNAPASPSAGVSQGSPPAGMMGGMGMMGAGRGGMGMMMGSRGMSGRDEDEDEGTGPMHRWRHGADGRDIPVQVIINIGPDNRVETEERGWRGGGGGPRWGMMGREWRGRSMADHVAAHLDYLHDQLQLTQEQQPAWDRFASAVRGAVTRMRLALWHGAGPKPRAEARGSGSHAQLASRGDPVRARRIV